MSDEIAQDNQVKTQEESPSVEAPDDRALATQSRGNGADQSDLNRILDIPLILSAQLGSARLLIKELLQLGPGSVVELDKLAGEPLEVFVNDKLVARGEVVMINEKYGIRLTDVVSPTERVNKLA